MNIYGCTDPLNTYKMLTGERLSKILSLSNKKRQSSTNGDDYNAGISISKDVFELLDSINYFKDLLVLIVSLNVLKSFLFF